MKYIAKCIPPNAVVGNCNGDNLETVRNWCKLITGKPDRYHVTRIEIYERIEKLIETVTAETVSVKPDASH